MRILSILLLAISCCAEPVLAQIGSHGDYFNLEWGDRNRFRGEVQRIVDVNHRSFTVIINRTNFFTALFPNSRRLIFREVGGLSTHSEGKIRLKGDGRNVVATDVIDLGPDLITIAQRSRFWSSKNELFYHKFNYKNPNAVIEGTKIISYFRPATPPHLKQLGLVSSEDITKAAAYYTIPVRQGDFPGFGYVLFDNARGEYEKNTQQIPYVNFQLEIYDQFVSNNGDLYALAKEYYRHNPSLPWSFMNRYFAKVRAFKAVDGKFQEFEINQPDYIIQEFKMHTDENGNFICSGFYADDIWSGVRGVFVLELDRNTNEVVRSTKMPFTPEFLSSGVAAWERSWRDRFRANTARQQGLGDFKILEFRKTADGGFIGIAEHQDMQLRERVTGSEENQKVRIDQLYYYDDMIVYKISVDGKLEWARRIPKNQQSTNDEGYFLSAAHAVTNDRVFLLFNDSKRNYNDDGTYGDAEFPFPAAMVGPWNVIGSVEIDLKTGEMKRRMLPGRSETRTTFVPKYSRFDVRSNEMIIYGKNNRRHRFGLVSFR